jgi:peroxiredoxin
MFKTARFCALFTLLFAFLPSTALQAQKQATPADPQVVEIIGQIKQLRAVPDAERGPATRKLALEIRALPPTRSKLSLALHLSGLATEGYFGEGTLQEVSTTLQQALLEQPQPREDGYPAAPYMELATLVRYEHVDATLNDPQFTSALARLEEEDRQREAADFTAVDLAGKSWHLKELQGKVVLLNFWATWCPPCRKEMPDLQKLANEFAPQGLVLLAVSDETVERVKPFLAKQGITYPVLLDDGGKIHRDFRVEGIPKSFLFDREGKMVAVAIDMRTREQFLGMLQRAGLKTR